MMAYQKVYEAEKPVCGAQQWMAMELFLQKMGFGPEKKFDGAEYPVLALNF